MAMPNRGGRMDTPLKSLARFIASFLPVIYCAYLVRYFINQSGSLQEAENNGLGPTVWGLTIVGGLFCIPIIVKLVLIFIELRRPKLRVEPHDDDDGDGFDADAVVARYLAQRPAQADSGARTASPPGFGRKNK
jgi:hypothetical protein